MLPADVFQSIFDHSPIGEYLLSPSDDPVVLAVNDAFLRAAGLRREAMVGQRLFALFPGNPDDPGDTGVAALRRSFVRVIATGQPDPLPMQRYPIRVTGAGGEPVYEERYWSAVSTPITDAQGRLVCIAHRTEDVTGQWRTAQALQRSTERQTFQLALEDRLRPLTSPEEIATTAARMLGERLGITRVTYVEVDDASSTFVQRHWTSPGKVPLPEGTRRLDDFGPEIVAVLRAGLPLRIDDVREDPRTRLHADAYAAIGVRSNLAIPLLKSGRLTTVLSLQHDQPRSWPGSEEELATDVAERTWSAAENARAQLQLQEESRRKDEFLAMLAHELRNPLAPISIAAELLARHRLDEVRLRTTSEVIARQVRHMTGLVDDLLDVSRVTRGLVHIDASPQDLRGIVANAVEQARPLLEAQKHQLTLDLPPEPALVSGDAKRLVQVLANLLNNAAKYTPPGGHIEVGVEVREDVVLARVKDDGIGIAKELQPHVFELFAQAERTPDRSQGGLGLGLALVRSLVELHKGRVSVTSDGKGTGSCFAVRLPRLRTAVPDPLGPGRPPGPAGDQGLAVLVVDDNEDAADMLRLLLEGAGHRVSVAHEPLGALERAATQPPEVGLIDIGLPGMDGYELVRRLRQSPTTAPARYIALTGYGQEQDRRAALAAGFDEHLVKPVDPDRLLQLLDGLARR